MKIVKMFLIIVAIIIVSAILTLICLLNWPTGQKHPSGKDTMYSFGDGTYQILRNGVSNKGKILMCLDPPQTVIIKVVKKYIDHKDQKTAYIIGDNSYVILKYEDKSIKIVQDLNTLPSDERKVFEGME